MLSVLGKLFHPLAITLVAGILFLIGVTFLIFPINKEAAICPKCNIIVIDIDSLRADELPCFGYYRNTTPNICRLAENGVVFENHFSQSSWTMPNQFSFLTSVNPEIHKVKNPFIDKLDDRIITLTESLNENGYKTGWAGYTLFTVNKENGGLRGFSDVYPEALTIDSWQTIIDEYYQSYQQNKVPFFVYFYNSDLHFPYPLESRDSHEWLASIPNDYPVTKSEIDKIVISFLKTHFHEIFSQEIIAEFPEIFSGANDIDEGKLLERFWSWASAKFSGTNKEKTEMLSQLNLRVWRIVYDEVTKSMVAQKYGNQVAKFTRAKYDVRLSQIDKNLGGFIDMLLTDQKYRDNTIIIFLSDHGDEFLEHGGFEHHTVYNELLKIPLIIKIPGFPSKKITAQTQTIDILPTLFDLVGINLPKSVQGISLVSYMQRKENTTMEDRYVISSTAVSTAIQSRQWKLIVNQLPNKIQTELYNLVVDPEETDNIRSKFRQIEASLLMELKEVSANHDQF